MDPGLLAHEKAHLVALCREPEVANLLSGPAGATVGVMAAKYMKLGRTAQVLLGVAGFGLGRLLYDHLTHVIRQPERDRHFSHWNDTINSYEINRRVY